jgi:hypothetical protein
LSTARVLLLHPPGDGRARYQLDGYCSQPQKGPFRWHPLDFCSFSAGLLRDDVAVEILDLGIRGLEPPRSYGAYDLIIGLVGAWGWLPQRRFWLDLIRAGAPPVHLSGDIARHEPRFVFDEIDGLAGIIPELARPPSLSDLVGEGPAATVWRREQDEFRIPRPSRGFEIGVQPFGSWDLKRYRLPFDTPEPFASVFTQVGCPHRCEYCILASYAPAFRDLDEVLDELREARSAGCRHIYVRDATFNTAPHHFLAVAGRLAKLGLTWNAFARIENVGSYADELYRAGCRVLQFGIDSPDPKALAGRQKDTRGIDVREELVRVRQAGIKTVGHFVYGLEDPPMSPRSIASYASSVGLDWLTISPLMVRPGTALWSSSAMERFDRLDARRVPTVLPAMVQFYAMPNRAVSTTLPTLAKWLTASMPIG